MSEEYMKIDEQIDQIKNLKLTPDFIINIKVCTFSRVECALKPWSGIVLHNVPLKFPSGNLALLPDTLIVPSAQTWIWCRGCHVWSSSQRRDGWTAGTSSSARRSTGRRTGVRRSFRSVPTHPSSFSSIVFRGMIIWFAIWYLYFPQPYIWCPLPKEEDPQKDIADKMVQTPENVARNALARINMYMDIMLRPLEVSYRVPRVLNGSECLDYVQSCQSSSFSLDLSILNRSTIPFSTTNTHKKCELLNWSLW